jgi:hypothetical protein
MYVSIEGAVSDQPRSRKNSWPTGVTVLPLLLQPGIARPGLVANLLPTTSLVESLRPLPTAVTRHTLRLAAKWLRRTHSKRRKGLAIGLVVIWSFAITSCELLVPSESWLLARIPLTYTHQSNDQYRSRAPWRYSSRYPRFRTPKHPLGKVWRRISFDLQP